MEVLPKRSTFYLLGLKIGSNFFLDFLGSTLLGLFAGPASDFLGTADPGLVGSFDLGSRVDA